MEDMERYGGGPSSRAEDGARGDLVSLEEGGVQTWWESVWL